MNIEYEATFINIDKEEIRKKLLAVGAKLIKPEFLQKRVVFNLPQGHKIPGAWLRVRDENDKITMSLKVVSGDKIEDQKEICLEINDFANAVKLLETIGCEKKSYQENKRELWVIEETEVTIDEWPFLEPFIEIESKTEAEVKKISQLLDFDYNQALFCSTTSLYKNKYGLSEKIINDETPMITFEMDNPLINRK